MPRPWGNVRCGALALCAAARGTRRARDGSGLCSQPGPLSVARKALSSQTAELPKCRFSFAQVGRRCSGAGRRALAGSRGDAAPPALCPTDRTHLVEVSPAQTVADVKAAVESLQGEPHGA